MGILSPGCKGYRMNQAQTVIPLSISKLKRVRMRLPPPRLFDELLGCRGNKRFFALWWSRADQAPVMDDGVFESFGMPAPYRVWRYHPDVMAALARYNIGDAAITADHWLLVDRKSRALYAGKVWDVLEVLDCQKRGAPEPLNETGVTGIHTGIMDIQCEDGDASGKGLEEPVNRGEKLLDELEAWLAANLAGG